MSKSFIFPYGITLRENGVIDTLPVAEVGFKNKKGEEFSLFLIIDSGATISALPKSDAEVLGIDVEDGKPMAISSIGSEKLLGWRHNIAIRLKNTIIQLPIVFLDKKIGPRILGRACIFEQFILVFEEKQRRTAFIGEDEQEARSIQKVLNKIQ